MSEQFTPTTEHVRSLALRLMNAAEFDRWLSKIKDAAWDEGYTAGYRYNGRRDENPYRTEGDRHVDQ